MGYSSQVGSSYLSESFFNRNPSLPKKMLQLMLEYVPGALEYNNFSLRRLTVSVCQSLYHRNMNLDILLYYIINLQTL